MSAGDRIYTYAIHLCNFTLSTMYTFKGYENV